MHPTPAIRGTNYGRRRVGVGVQKPAVKKLSYLLSWILEKNCVAWGAKIHVPDNNVGTRFCSEQPIWYESPRVNTSPQEPHFSICWGLWGWKNIFIVCLFRGLVYWWNLGWWDFEIVTPFQMFLSRIQRI